MTARRQENLATPPSLPVIADGEDAETLGCRAVQVRLDERLIAVGNSAIYVLAVGKALTQLATLDRRSADIIEPHFCVRLRSEETALRLVISTRTVKRNRIMERARLRGELALTR